MADLGSIGTLGYYTTTGYVQPPGGYHLAGLVAGSMAASTVVGNRWEWRCVFQGERYTARGGKNIIEGTPAQPCLELSHKGVWRFRWVVKGSFDNKISCWAKQVVNANPRPTLAVKGNSEVGLLTDAIGTAPSGTGWVKIGPVTFNPPTSGAVWVELANNCDIQLTPCFFDFIERT